jgi:hypothetical protein
MPEDAYVKFRCFLLLCSRHCVNSFSYSFMPWGGGGNKGLQETEKKEVLQLQ